MPRILTRSIAAGLTTSIMLAAGAATALADTISLFGQQYDIQRFDYSQMVAWPSTAIPGNTVRLVEVEGIHFVSNDLVYFSSDAIGEVFPGEPKNFVIEARLTSAGDTITGLAFNRVVLSNRAPTQFPAGPFDLDAAGVTINTSSTGIGGGGNLVLTSQKTKLRGYSLQAGSFGIPLLAAGGPCPTADCSTSTASGVTDGEDLCFVPGFETRPPAFYVLDQEFPDRAVRFSVTGQLENSASFLIGGDAPAMNDPDSIATPKGICFMPESNLFPASVSRPGGTLMVALDNDVPGLQVFDFAGNMLAFEPLTVEVPTFRSLLPMGDCDDVPQLESVAVDPATGRLFLVNQGNGLTCNIVWILTPVASTPTGCSPADIANTDGDPAPDNSIDNGDFTAFFSAFFLPASDPLSLIADIANTDGETRIEGAGPDGTVDNGDFTAFFTNFFLGCP